MRNNRGVSSVVATVMIIAITIAAVAVLVGVVIPLVSEGPAAEKACYNVMQSLSINEEYTSSSNDGKTVNISVSYTGEGDELVGLNLVCFDSTGNSETTESFDIPKNGESEIYGCTNNNKVVQLKIYPIVEVKTKNVTCDSPIEVDLN